MAKVEVVLMVAQSVTITGGTEILPRIHLRSMRLKYILSSTDPKLKLSAPAV